MHPPTRLAAEVAEQPAVLERLLRRTLPRLDEIGDVLTAGGDVRGVVVAARGSSDNAARYAQYLWPVLGADSDGGLPVTLATPSLQTVYGREPALDGQLVVAISQSGSSPDVVGVLAAARAQGRPAIAVTNDPGSDLARAADVVLDLGTGAERSVAATKTYTASLLAVGLLAVALPGGSARAGAVDDLSAVPDAVADVLRRTGSDDALGHAAAMLGRHDRGVVVGRGLNLGTAHEIALKVTELAGLLMAPYSPADLRHGPLGAVGPATPVLLVLPDEPASASVAELAEELVDRSAPVLAIADPAGPGAAALSHADVVLGCASRPSLAGWLSPLTAVLPGQLLAAAVAAARGVDVDHPGGLTKITRTR